MLPFWAAATQGDDKPCRGLHGESGEEPSPVMLPQWRLPGRGRVTTSASRMKIERVEQGLAALGKYRVVEA